MLLLAGLLMHAVLLAQGAHDAGIKFGKTERTGFAVEYPYSKGITENAVREQLEKAGLGKAKTEKGFLSYQGVKWGALSPTQVDVYVKVEANKADNRSTISLLISKGYDNYVSSASDPEMAVKLKSFLDGLLPEIKNGQAQADIQAQEEVVRRAEQSFKDAEAEGARLAREREKLEKQIADNNTEKQKQAADLGSAKARLGQMKADAGK